MNNEFCWVLDVPKLPPLVGEDEDEVEEKLPVKEEVPIPSSSPKKKRDQPKITNPYSEETSMMLPVFVAIAAFIPFLFCLCKL